MMLDTRFFSFLLRHRAKVKGSKIVSILVFLLCTNMARTHAQEYIQEYHDLSAGLVGGVNFTQVDGDGYKGYSKTGITGGGIIYLPFGQVDLPFDATIALSMEVLFTQKGAKGNGAVPGTSVFNQKTNLQYAEIPFQLNLYRGPRKSGFGMGLSIGYLASSEETIEQQGGVVLKNSLPFNKFDLNYVLTGNIHLWNGFFLSPRFQYSLLSIRSGSEDAGYGGRNQQFKNLVELRIMYLFGNVSGG
jgi:hypothetical protein